MPNAIKYNTSVETLALKKGNFYIGTGDVGKGPTSSKAYYNGITPPSGGYTIYLNKETGGPSIYTVTTEAQMVSLTNTIGAQSFTTSGQCLNWFATQTDKMIFNIDYPTIVTNGLVMNLDAGFTPSYPKTETTWYDVSSSGNNGTLTNGPTFNSGDGGSIVFDRVDDYAGFNINASNIYNAGELTFSVWYKVVSSQPDSSLLEIGGNWNNWSLYWDLVDPTGCLSFSITGNYSNGRVVATTNTKTGAWFNSCGTFSSNTSKIYTNGNLENIRTSISLLNQSGILEGRIANDAVNSRLGANIAIVQIYNRSLSAQEVLQNYNALKGRFGLS